jgi:lysophospholipase L1-like esterase
MMLSLANTLVSARASGGGFVGPLDAVPGALAAWGLVPLSAAMIGQNGFKLRKTADSSTQDFAFSDESTPVTAVDAWKGAETTYNARKACFDTIYDQVGTNHVSQATTTAQPAWLQLPDGSVVAALNGDNLGRNAFLNIPNMSLNARNVTVYHVFRGADRTSSISSVESVDQHPAFGWLVSGGFAGWIGAENPSFRALARSWRGGSYDDNVSRPSNCHAQVACLRWDGTDTIYSLNDAVRLTTGQQVNDTLTSGAIGKLATFGIYSLNSQWLATVIYPAHSDSQMAATMAALRERFSLDAWTHNILFDGDSITSGHAEDEGFYDVRYLAWPSEMYQTLGNAALRFTNTAISSQTLATMETNAANKIDPNYSASIFGTNNILVVFAGTNDINAGADAATTYSRLQTYVASRYSAGWDKIIVCTAIPREPFNGTQNTHLANFNASILADAGDFDGVVDLAALSWDFATHYQGSTPNRIHPNAAGRTLIVNAVQPVLEALL